MEDLKLFSRDETKLQQVLTIVYTFSDDIQMEFDLHKCTTAVFMLGKLTKIQNIIINNQTVIRNMEMDKTCKYIGTEEGEGIDNSQKKHKLVK
jgi:hypothetical protein